MAKLVLIIIAVPILVYWALIKNLEREAGNYTPIANGT